MRVIHGNARVDVGCGDGQGRVQLFESRNGSETGKIFSQALVGGQAEPRRCPTAEIGKARLRANFLHFIKRCPSTETRADQCAHACACDAVDGDASFPQNAQDSDVRNAAGKSARKSQADAWTFLGFASLAVRESAKLVLCRPQPAERAGEFAFFGHLIILTHRCGSARRLTRACRFCNLFLRTKLTSVNPVKKACHESSHRKGSGDGSWNDGLADRGTFRERRAAVHFAGHGSAEFTRECARWRAQQNCTRWIGCGEKIEAGRLFYGCACGKDCYWELR